MLSWTKTEVIIEEDDDEKENMQIDLDWWIARCEYFKNRCLDLEEENKKLKKMLKRY